MTLTLLAAPAASTVLPAPIVLLRSRDVRHADRAVATGELLRVRRGILAVADQWNALAPWDRYVARVHAAVLMYPDAVVAFESSAALRGWPIFGDPVTVHLLDDALGSSRAIGGIRTHTTRSHREVDEIGGIRLVGAADTVVDVSRSRHRAVGLSIADAALREERGLTAEILVAVNESRLDARGRRHARWVTHRATPQAETVLESISRAAIEWLGFDAPDLQRRFVTDGHRDRVDMWWEDPRVVGESDGDVKYDGSLQPAVRAIRDRADRDRRLARHARGIAHWGWSDVLRVEPLRDSLRRAGLRIRHSEDSRELAGLRSLHRPVP